MLWGKKISPGKEIETGDSPRFRVTGFLSEEVTVEEKPQPLGKLDPVRMVGGVLQAGAPASADPRSALGDKQAHVAGADGDSLCGGSWSRVLSRKCRAPRISGLLRGVENRQKAGREEPQAGHRQETQWTS